MKEGVRRAVHMAIIHQEVFPIISHDYLPEIRERGSL